MFGNLRAIDGFFYMEKEVLGFISVVKMILEFWGLCYVEDEGVYPSSFVSFV